MDTKLWNELLPFHGEKLEIAAEVSDDESTGVIYLHGQLITENSPTVMAHLHHVLTVVSLPDTIILDLRGLRYASSTGIGVIAKLLVDLQHRSVALELANVADSVRAIFDLLGFSAFFHFVERR
ncbi:MAG: STAS domain-containing protein [Alkalispirochaeta sp.]